MTHEEVGPHKALERTIVELERISSWIPADYISQYQVSRIAKVAKLLDGVLNGTEREPNDRP